MPYGKFKFISVGQILKELKEEAGLDISWIRFDQLEKQGLFISSRTIGGVRKYTRTEANVIKALILDEYGKLED